MKYIFSVTITLKFALKMFLKKCILKVLTISKRMLTLYGHNNKVEDCNNMYLKLWNQ